MVSRPVRVVLLAKAHHTCTHNRKGTEMAQELRCPYCSEVTTWPEENHVQMMVYGINHRIDCYLSPADLRAEAILMLESIRAEEPDV